MTDTTDTDHKRMGRPPIHEVAMTPSQRAAASKIRKREQAQQRKLAAEAASDDAEHGRIELLAQTHHVALTDALAAAIDGLEGVDKAQAHDRRRKIASAVMTELVRRYGLALPAVATDLDAQQ